MRLILSIPICLLLGFGSGFAFFHGPTPLTPAGVAQLEKEMAVNPAAWPDSPAAPDAKAQRLLAAVLRKGGSLENKDEIYLAVKAFTAADFRRLLLDVGALQAMAEKLGGIDYREGKEIASALAEHWLALDPDTVMKWAPRMLELIPLSRDARDGIPLEILAQKRPEEMLALLPSQKDPAQRALIISRALSELASRDIAKARAWLSRCTDPAERRTAEQAIRAGTVQSDPLRAIELAEAAENRSDGFALIAAGAERAVEMGPGVLRRLATSKMPSWMFSAVIDQFSEIDPELAVELATHSDAHGEVIDSNVRTAFSSLAERDLPQAILKTGELQGPERAAAISAIGLAWAAQDPAGALNWLLQRPAAERADPSRWSFGSHDTFLIVYSEWVRTGRDDARAWADALPPGPVHDSVQTQFARVIGERGEAAEATRILAQLGAAADPKAVTAAARALTRSDPKAAADWAVSQPPGPVQNSALAGIVATWASNEPEAVGEWLAQFPPGQARDRSVATFLQRSGPGPANRIAEFDAWFNFIADPWQRAQVATASFRQRSRRDPAGARAWLAALPNVDAEVIRMALRNNP